MLWCAVQIFRSPGLFKAYYSSSLHATLSAHADQLGGYKWPRFLEMLLRSDALVANIPVLVRQTGAAV